MSGPLNFEMRFRCPDCHQAVPAVQYMFFDIIVPSHDVHGVECDGSDVLRSGDFEWEPGVIGVPVARIA